MAATATRPWQAEIIDQLGAADDDPALTHAVVYLPPPEATDEVDLLDRCDTAASALISAEDWATKVEGGEVRIVTLADLVAWNRDHDHPVDGPTIEPRRQNVETEEPETVIETADDEPDVPAEEPTPAHEPAPAAQRVQIPQQLSFDIGGDQARPTGASFNVSGRGEIRNQLLMGDDVTLRVIAADGEIVAEFEGSVSNVAFKRHDATETTNEWVERAHTIKLGDRVETG